MSEGQRIHLITAAHGVLPSLHAAFSTEAINERPHSDILPRRRLNSTPSKPATVSLEDEMDILEHKPPKPAYSDDIYHHAMLVRSFSVPSPEEYSRQFEDRSLSDVFHDLVMAQTYTVKNLKQIQHDEEEVAKLYRLTMTDLYDNPEYTDSLTSTSSKSALLSQTARALTKDKQKELIGKVIETTEKKKKELKNIMKNLIVLSAGVMFMFGAYSSLRNLQTSINTEGGLGVICLSVVYIAFFLGCLIAPLMVRLLRPKPTLLLAYSANVVYVVCNFYPSFYTMVPGSICVGFFLGNMWTAHGTYLTSIAIRYAQLTRKDIQKVLTRFNGITFMFFQIANIFGGLISSLVLTDSKMASAVAGEIGNGTVLTALNESYLNNQSVHLISYIADNNTFINSTGHFLHNNVIGSPPDLFRNQTSGHKIFNGECGSGFCPGNSVKSKTGGVSMRLIYILLGIYLGFASLSVLITLIWLDRLEGVMKLTEATLSTQLLCVIKFFFDKRVMLLLGLMFFSLPQVSFMYGEFTKAFVTCSYGVSMVGYTMVCVSILGCTSSLFNALLFKFIGRTGLLIVAASINVGLLVVMLLWKPTPETIAVLFVIGAFWGIADGVWFTQLISLFGYLFSENKEAAFAGLKMCQSLGVAVAFGVSEYLCTSTKIYLLMLLLVLGMVGYIILEGMLKNEEALKERQRKETSV